MDLSAPDEMRYNLHLELKTRVGQTRSWEAASRICSVIWKITAMETNLLAVLIFEISFRAEWVSLSSHKRVVQVRVLSRLFTAA
jgi:hypothetical protein